MDQETLFIINGLFLIVCGILSMTMAAGFAMLESGLVRAQNTTSACLKIIAIYTIAALSFYIVGYNIMYLNVSAHGLWGSFKFFYDPPLSELTTQTNTPGLFFTLSFAAIAGAIVSGTLAERVKLWPFLIFIFVLSALIFPLQGAWSWGGGWLNDISGGFKDFGGASVIHSVGGWCALSGALILGPRLGKYESDGRVKAFPGANIPLATLGALVLWMGWLAFHAGMNDDLNSPKVLASLNMILVNSTLAAAAGGLVAMFYTKVRYGKPDITLVLNGLLAGLVSISANANMIEPFNALFIGGLGGLFCVLAVAGFDKLKIDDAVGALSVHLVGGLWGTLAVAIFSTGDFLAQIAGILSIGTFSLLFSTLAWLALKRTTGLRITEKDENNGTDCAEIGIKAYPDFEVNSAG